MRNIGDIGGLPLIGQSVKNDFWYYEQLPLELRNIMKDLPICTGATEVFYKWKRDGLENTKAGVLRWQAKHFPDYSPIRLKSKKIV